MFEIIIFNIYVTQTCFKYPAKIDVDRNCMLNKIECTIVNIHNS